MAPVKHTAGSAVSTVVGHTASRGIGYGLMGALTGGVIVAAVTALAATSLVGLAGGIAAVYTGEGMATVGAFIKAASTAIGVIASMGGVVGIAGGGLGGGLLGGISGIFSGSEKVSDDEREYRDVKTSTQKSIGAAIESRAAEKYTQVGYGQGFQDGVQVGQAAVINQIQQQMQMAQAAEMQAMQNTNMTAAPAAQEGGFAAKEKKKPCCTHTEAVTANAAASTGAHLG